MFGRLYLILFLAAFAVSCANRGYPEGGPKDEDPPYMTKEDPVSFTINFDEKRVKIYFNEFIQLKDVNSTLVVSPPLKKKPTVSNRGKYIVIDFSRDTLKEDATYNLDFGNSIVDNNESNPLGYYRYVFSTGDFIDSMEMGGTVVDAESGDPLLKVLVAIYKQHEDSIPIKEIPDFIAMTDSAGVFHFTNIQDSLYKIVAFADQNSDYKYVPETEPIAFLDSLFHPVVFHLDLRDTIYHTEYDSITKETIVDSTLIDSIIITPYNAYGPSNIAMRLFAEVVTSNYMESPKRTKREQIGLIFSIPNGGDQLKLSLVDSLLRDSVPGDDWYFVEKNPTNDSLTIWFMDSLVYRRDTLNIAFDYLKQDSLKQLTITTDTFRLTYKPPKPMGGNKRRQQEEDTTTIEYTNIAIFPRSKLEINGYPYLKPERPLKEIRPEYILLEHKLDSSYEEIPFTLEEDTIEVRRYNIKGEFDEGETYRITIDTAVMWDIYGQPIAGATAEMTVKETKDYGNLTVILRNVHNRPIILELYSSKKSGGGGGGRGNSNSTITLSPTSTFPVVTSKCVDTDGNVEFPLLNEGNYMLRAIIDENRNGIWDTGRYLDHIQPEEIIYQYIELSVKSNFDIEQTFDLDIDYPRPVEEVPEDNRNNNNNNRNNNNRR